MRLRNLILATAAWSCFTLVSEAGLQSAFESRLLNVQPAITPISFVGSINLPISLPGVDSDGSIFIDPESSRLGSLRKVDGPSARYDPVSGALEVSVPPLLGPLDLFGNRSTYHVQSIELSHSGNIKSDQELPKITTYSRPSTFFLVGATPADRLLKTDGPDATYNLLVEENRIVISQFERVSGVEAKFNNFLLPSLDASLFDRAEAISSFLRINDYDTQSAQQISLSISYNQDFSLYATGLSSVTVQPQVTVIPEPLSFLICVSGLAAFSAFHLIRPSARLRS